MLRIEQTKSRSRQTNDNALVESKNGSTVRKHLGYSHIPGRYAQQVNVFASQILTPYLNFHRPCFFPTEITDAKGKLRKKYRYEDMMTPYEKLKSLPEAHRYLKQGQNFFNLSINPNAPPDRLTHQPYRFFRLISGLENTV